MTDLPQTKFEKALEIKILTLIKEAVEEGCSFTEALAVLERVRHFTTETKLELGID